MRCTGFIFGTFSVIMCVSLPFWALHGIEQRLTPVFLGSRFIRFNDHYLPTCRRGAGPQGAMAQISQTMMASGATFATFMSALLRLLEDARLRS